MSISTRLPQGTNFHFYHEAFDDDHVYLRLDTSHFEAGYGRVTVQIPIRERQRQREVKARIAALQKDEKKFDAASAPAADAHKGVFKTRRP